MEPDWDDVRVVMTLLRTRSLAAASRSLGLDRSTVSRRVAALEHALGTPLFLRTREGLRPAAAVERLRVHAERVEAQMRAFVDAARVREREVGGVVRLATTDALAPFLVQRGLLDVCREHPGLVIELLAGNRSVDLARGEAELALRFSPAREAALRTRVLARIGIALFASPAYLHRRGLPRSDGELAGHDVLLPCGELSSLPEGKWLGSRPGVRVVFRSSSMASLFAAATAGLGIAALSQPWAELEPGLQLVAPLERVAARPLSLVVQPAVAQRPEVRLVIARLVQIFAPLSGSRRRSLSR